MSYSSIATSGPLPELDGAVHRFVHERGLQFHVVEAGTGQPVLALHGFPQHWYAWRHVMARLAGDYRLLCLDLRGFGWSEAPRRGYDTATRVDDVLAVLDELGLQRVRLIGHEWGGRLGFQLCLRAPDRFSHFLALNTLHPWPLRGQLLQSAWRQWYTALVEYPWLGRWMLRRPATTRWLLRRGVADPATWQPAVLNEYARVASEPARARAGQELHWQFVLHDIPRLIVGRDRRNRLDVPTVILAGDRDPALSTRAMTGGDQYASDLTVRVVPDAGQYLPEERPDVVAAAARELFGR